MMDKPLTVKHNFTGDFCVPCIQSRQEEVHQWLLGHEKKETPFYSSVDIRDAGFKMTVVDTNLFPAGFNNLCEHGLADASHFIREAILKRVPGAHKILIVTEEHTRNTGYLENVSILQDIIRKAGFEVNVAFPEDIKTACTPCDLIVMNNDLSGGIPDALKKSNIPVFPSMHAGWHARLKSGHFAQTSRLAEEFARIVGLDPWLFSCLFEAVDDVDVNSDDGHQKLHDAAVRLFDGVRAKYKEHHINEKPFVFIKADSGTYGMGVVPIEDPSMVLELNRKKRNDLLRGKSGQLVTRFLLQEGVPTIQRIEESPCEVCIYQIDNNLIGGFYRYHTGKGSRENLNSPGGMAFQKVCPHLGKYGQDCGVKHNMNIFDIYRILARIAGVAAGRETRELESQAR
ncbi:MAG: glutamate--cysteine ligase [Candidatus Omnitrophica bacterium]|nr:glutamate--cysteine ligase [Candidatus Omnitrophota bacterium]